MEVKDKNNVLSGLAGRGKVIIEIGCGERKIAPDAIGVDIVDGPNVDVVADISAGMSFLPNGSVDEIHAYHVIEHLPDTGLVMAEIHRVLKPGGRFLGAVPHFSNPYYYSDHTHKTFFGLYSFSYFPQHQPFSRKVPAHYNSLDFKIVRIKLVFWSPFKLINVFRKIQGVVFNATRGMQELYEGSCSNVFSVHEIAFVLEK